MKSQQRCATLARMPPQASNLSELLRTLAATYGERAAVVGEQSALTFAALDHIADAWAQALGAAGLGPGAHVGLLAGNGPEWLAVAFGTWRAGATLVPISTFATARELEQTLEHADVGALVMQPRLRSHNYLDALAQTDLPRLQRRIALADHAPAPYETAAEFLKTAPISPRSDVTQSASIDAESIVCLLYTSGTTGQPKGVKLSHRAMLATVLPTAERTGLDSNDSLLSTLPLFWVAGLVIRALPTLATGCCLILVETFTADAVLTALQRHRPTALHLRPPQVGQILAHPDFSPELLAHVRKGGGRAEWYEPHLDAARLITGYGMTEMAGYVTALDWQDPTDARRTQLGRPLPGVEIRIVDERGRVCGAEEVGEIRVNGPGMFSGYHRQPPRMGLDGDGFFRTGDLGRIDREGILHFVGRHKDLLRVKGINVSPVEVETVLNGHPAVELAYVVGLPPDALEQDLVALIVGKPGERPTESELRALASDALSHYKRPAQYIFVERSDIPLGGTAKPQRTALAELAAKRLGGIVPKGHRPGNESPGSNSEAR